MKINSFRFLSCDLLPKLGEYTTFEFSFLVESDKTKPEHKNIPSNYLLLKVSDNLNMIWELEASKYNLSDVLFEYTKNYILYKMSKDNLQRKEILEISEFHKNVLLYYSNNNLSGFSTESIPIPNNPT